MSSNEQTSSTPSEILSPLNAATIKRVEEGVAAAGDRTIRQMITETLSQLESLQEQHSTARTNPRIRRMVLRSLIHCIFQVKVENSEHIPQQPSILAVNHLHHLDPLLLLAEIPHQPCYYILGDARTLYNKWWKRLILKVVGGVIPLARIWKEELAVIQAAKAGREELINLAQVIEETVPTGTEIHTLRQIDRIVLKILAHGHSLIIFPEGRLGNTEGKLHLPLKRGTVIYALRAGVPIVPAALIGTQDLYWGKKLTVRFGQPLHFTPNDRPKRPDVEAALETLQNAIVSLLPSDYQEPTGIKPLRHFLNHMLW